ncbi:DIS3-like exonuclease 1 [Caerostris darwini]|uniref:DIS3-like exonuclease 1 n=1 Tax=Caerostris darwini TaxID=1538125 RepID=A0AAV4TDB6_9ARAC|nr:DIS3-like exonuclease 1 [Caerostris darwini]
MDSSETETFCHHMNIKHRAAQDLEKDAQQLFLSFYFEDLNSQENSSPCFVDAVIYALRANGLLVFVPKYGIKGAVCLCNKDRKVALVNDSVEWTDGKLISTESKLTVQANGTSQHYHIFDHVTVCVKVQKSRSHQHRIVLDMVDNKPFAKDFNEVKKERMDLTFLQESKDVDIDSPEAELKNSIPTEPEENMYLFLQKIRNLTLN